MPILPSVQHYITSEETEFEAPVAESVGQNFGEAINYLNDLLANNIFEYTANDSLIVPASVTKGIIFGCGGGGGGGNGLTGIDASNQSSGGGGGGAGAPLMFRFVRFNPGGLLTITVGAAGGPGANGGNSFVSGTGLPQVGQILFPGAAKGANGALAGPSPGNTNGGLGGVGFAIGTIRDSYEVPYVGGRGGHTLTITSESGLVSPATISIQGGSQSTSAGVGVGGTQSGGGYGGGGGGAGARSSFGLGGAGGRGCDNTANNAAAGVSALATNYGAGGGGGGGGAEAANRPGGAGGSGAVGYVLIAWF